MSISKNVKMIKEICLYREVCNILQLRCSVFWIHVGFFLGGLGKIILIHSDMQPKLGNMLHHNMMSLEFYIIRGCES